LNLWDWGRPGIRDCAVDGWDGESVQRRKLDSAGMVKVCAFPLDSPGVTRDAACSDGFLTIVLESSAMDPKWFVQVDDRITGG